MAANLNINSVINLNLPAVVPDAFTNPEVRAAVEMFLNTFNNLLRSIEQFGGFTSKDVTQWNVLQPSDTLLRYQLGRLYPIASEDIPFGSFINLHDSGGELRARKANAAAGSVRPARGYCSQDGGILTGERGEIILSLGLVGIAGVAPGQEIFLSTIAGVATLVAPVAVGTLTQYLGVGVATDIVYVDIASGFYRQN